MFHLSLHAVIGVLQHRSGPDQLGERGGEVWLVFKTSTKKHFEAYPYTTD
jgi:hypothetical protein